MLSVVRNPRYGKRWLRQRIVNQGLTNKLLSPNSLNREIVA